MERGVGGDKSESEREGQIMNKEQEKEEKSGRESGYSHLPVRRQDLSLRSPDPPLENACCIYGWR